MNLINKIIGKFFGKKSDKDIEKIKPVLDEINEFNKKILPYSNDKLREETINLKLEIKNFVKVEKEQIKNLKLEIEKEENISEREKKYAIIDNLEEEITKKLEEILNKILPKAFAIVKETARRFNENESLQVSANDFDRNLAAKHRHVIIEKDKAIYKNSWLAGGTEITWNMVHYDVQLIGGIILHQGKIAEMATGEGKTLVATLPVFLNALTGRGVHLVTVNDYLAKRDSEWMGPIYEFHGLSVDCIDKHEPNSESRRKAYLSDICFGTNNEFGFDYLRDNMAISPEDLVQRKHNYSIVDEVDSVLVDEARTPLIISGPVPKGDNQLFDELKPKIDQIVKAQNKFVHKLLIDAKKFIANKNTKEKGAVLLLRTFKGLPKNKPLIKFLGQTGMKTLLLKTEDIYLAENEKRMPEITEDLFFVIDEKRNSIDLTDKGIDFITKSTEDRDLFILPDIGTEIAEIEKSDLEASKKSIKKDELLADYSIKSERLHTINQLLKAYTLFEKDVEYVVMDNKVKIVDEQTGRIMDGRRYSDGLHQAIEAKENVKIESATQTFATITLQNYFRMYEKLAGMTGTAETEAGELWDIYKLDVVVIPTNRKIVRDDKEDFVFKTKREKYNAVIKEIVELTNANRPVLVGTTSVEVSELLSRALQIRRIRHNVLNAKLHQREADIIAEAGKAKTVTIATNMAGRGTDIKLKEEVIKSGGLAIIGTERHESRRVDRQLRGRSGRQGDPGSSQFFVSLEDNLMRMFGSDRISKMMDKLGIEDGEVIQHSMITKSIERAQKKVEENNFGIRKRLLEYDDVMNSQREVIYKQRRNALYGERIAIDISNMMVDVCENIVNTHHGFSEIEDFKHDALTTLSINPDIEKNEFLKEKPEKISNNLNSKLEEVYKRKSNNISEYVYNVIKEDFEKYKNDRQVIVPISDGIRFYQPILNLKNIYETKGKEVVKNFEKISILSTIDESWKEHLREMDDLRQSVQNASYEQKDPLLIFKFESFELFKTMIEKNSKEVISTLMKSRLVVEEEVKEASNSQIKKTDYSKMQTTKMDFDAEKQELNSNSNKQETKQPIRREEPKIGRNAPCPCGSGKKYKNCHGRN